MLPQEIHEQRKNALIRATVNVIADDGMEGLTTRGVGSLCGVKEVYIYRYFENRDDMVAKTFSYADKCLFRKIDEALSASEFEGEDFKVRFCRLLKLCFDYVLSYPDWLKFYLRYYYSAIFAKNSYEEHMERYRALSRRLLCVCESEAEAEELLHMLLEATLSRALRQCLYGCDEKAALEAISKIMFKAVEENEKCV